VERFSAQLFYKLARTLEYIQTSSSIRPSEDKVPAKLLEADSGHLKMVAQICSEINLKLSAKYALKMSEDFAQKTDITFTARAPMFEVLQDRIQDEMEDNLFMFIHPERADRYDQPELFGKAVNAKFPTNQEDIVETDKC